MSYTNKGMMIGQDKDAEVGRARVFLAVRVGRGDMLDKI